MHRSRIAVFVAVIGTLLVPLGCSQNQQKKSEGPAATQAGAAETSSPAPAIAKRDVQQFGMAYAMFLGEKKVSPQGLEDLEPKKASFGKLYDQIKDGHFVVIWKAALTQDGNANDRLVIGYEKKVPERGGLVLSGGGSVDEMSADDFKKATLAKTAS